MAHGIGTMTYDEKVALIAALPEIDDKTGFVEPTARASVGAKAIEWENQFPLDAWRRNVGKEKLIIPMVVGDNGEDKTKSLALAVKNRIMKVWPEESWAAVVHDGGVWLRYNGSKSHRSK